jgi:hypothetical protein
MQDLMKTNCYDVKDTLVIVGSCLERMQPEAYKKLEAMADTIYDVCLEQQHLNMVVTKLIGMLSRVKIKRVVFATVDKSPHCVQLHYVENEIRKAMRLEDVIMVHYVAIDNKLYEISYDTVKKSKSLYRLQNEGE